MDKANGLAWPVASLRFRVLPPWWKTRTALGIFCVCAASLLLLCWRWSHRMILERQQRLQDLVQERTLQLQAEKAELLEAKRILAQQASYDVLTSVLNRRAIMERLGSELDRCTREQSPLTIVLLDVDHFKQVNDSFGHLVGDEVLREFGQRLRSGLRTYDHCGRFGGEEFLVLLPESPDSSTRVQALFRHLTAFPFQLKEHSLPITCSFGVVRVGLEQATPEVWLGRADRALYAAKRGGRNRIEHAVLGELEVTASERVLSLG